MKMKTDVDIYKETLGKLHALSDLRKHKELNLHERIIRCKNLLDRAWYWDRASQCFTTEETQRKRVIRAQKIKAGDKV